MSLFRAATCVAIIAGLGLGACNNQPARPGTESAAPTTDAGAAVTAEAGMASPVEPAVEATKPPEASLPTASTVEEAFTVESSDLVPAKLVAEAVDKGVDILFVDARIVMDFELGHIPARSTSPTSRPRSTSPSCPRTSG